MVGLTDSHQSNQTSQFQAYEQAIQAEQYKHLQRDGQNGAQNKELPSSDNKSASHFDKSQNQKLDQKDDQRLAYDSGDFSSPSNKLLGKENNVVQVRDSYDNKELSVKLVNQIVTEHVTNNKEGHVDQDDDVKVELISSPILAPALSSMSNSHLNVMNGRQNVHNAKVRSSSGSTLVNRHFDRLDLGAAVSVDVEMDQARSKDFPLQNNQNAGLNVGCGVSKDQPNSGFNKQKQSQKQRTSSVGGNRSHHQTSQNHIVNVQNNAMYTHGGDLASNYSNQGHKMLEELTAQDEIIEEKDQHILALEQRNNHLQLEVKQMRKQLEGADEMYQNYQNLEHNYKQILTSFEKSEEIRREQKEMIVDQKAQVKTLKQKVRRQDAKIAELIEEMRDMKANLMQRSSAMDIQSAHNQPNVNDYSPIQLENDQIHQSQRQHQPMIMLRSNLDLPRKNQTGSVVGGGGISTPAYFDTGIIIDESQQRQTMRRQRSLSNDHVQSPQQNSSHSRNYNQYRQTNVSRSSLKRSSNLTASQNNSRGKKLQTSSQTQSGKQNILQQNLQQSSFRKTPRKRKDQHMSRSTSKGQKANRSRSRSSKKAKRLNVRDLSSQQHHRHQRSLSDGGLLEENQTEEFCLENYLDGQQFQNSQVFVAVLPKKQKVCSQSKNNMKMENQPVNNSKRTKKVSQRKHSKQSMQIINITTSGGGGAAGSENGQTRFVQKGAHTTKNVTKSVKVTKNNCQPTAHLLNQNAKFLKNQAKTPRATGVMNKTSGQIRRKINQKSVGIQKGLVEDSLPASTVDSSLTRSLSGSRRRFIGQNSTQFGLNPGEMQIVNGKPVNISQQNFSNNSFQGQQFRRNPRQGAFY